MAREVGVEGRLGGQANVPGAAGTWKDLTGNVNLLAANLTTQVRAIAEVATAVTKGDLTRSIQVDARGEVAELKDNINTMIDNLRLTTDRNNEQDWLKTNLARFTGLLQGQRDLATVGRTLLTELVPLVDAHQGTDLPDGRGRRPAPDGCSPATATPGPTVIPTGSTSARASSASARSTSAASWSPNVPPDTVPVGARRSSRRLPKIVIVLPVLFEGQIKAVLGLASLREFAPSHLTFLEQLTSNMGIVVNSIEATMQTEGLLKQSQQLAAELQTQQTELQQTNEQLEQKAQQLAEQNAEVERKNKEIEQARRAVEEKAAELALTSKYKSEFLANMSHELRTPLNSILILGQQLGDNPDGNLTAKQVEYARTIHSAGTDLLNLISDILDLSKIESGTVTVDAAEILFSDLLDTVARTFRHEAENRALSFDVRTDGRLSRSLVTDSKRLMQVLKNLLSNAFKFTERGGVTLTVSSVDERLEPGPSGAELRRLGRGLRGLGHRRRDPGREAEDHLRGLPAGGRQHQPQVRGHRASASRSAASWPSCSAARSSSAAPRARAASFTLYLPLRYAGPAVAARPNERAAPASRRSSPRSALPERIVEQVPDDRDSDRARRLRAAHRRGRPALRAGALGPRARQGLQGPGGDARRRGALTLTRQFRPTAISLDVFLPDMLGWTVLSQLKQDPATRHIPVQVVTLDEDRQHGLARGAFSFVTKPTTTDGLESALTRIREYAAKPPQAAAGRGRQRGRAAQHHGAARPRRHRDRNRGFRRGGAGRACSEQPYDCVVLDLRLPDMSGFDVLDRIGEDADPARPAGRRLHRQGAVAGGRRAAAHDGAERRRQGRRVAGAAARRDVAVPAPRGDRPAARRSRRCSIGCTAPTRTCSASRCWWWTTTCATSSRLSSVLERRGMKVLVRQHRTAGDHHARGDAGPGDRADGHHDAGDGRLRDDARDPPEPAPTGGCRSSRSPRRP